MDRDSWKGVAGFERHIEQSCPGFHEERQAPWLMGRLVSEQRTLGTTSSRRTRLHSEEVYPRRLLRQSGDGGIKIVRMDDWFSTNVSGVSQSELREHSSPCFFILQLCAGAGAAVTEERELSCEKWRWLRPPDGTWAGWGNPYWHLPRQCIWRSPKPFSSQTPTTRAPGHVPKAHLGAICSNAAPPGG